MELMSRRWTTLGVVNAVSVALVGWTLDQIGFPINYQVVFIASFIGGLISYYFSTSIVLPEGGHVPSRQPWYAAFAGMRQILATQPTFARFVGAQFIFRCGMSMALPLLPLYWVRVAQASDSSIGLINTVNSGVLMIAYAIWIAISRRRGERMVLLLCGAGLALYPLLVATSGSIWQLVLFAGMAGIFSAGADLVLFDLLVATCDPRMRGQSVGLYHTTTYIATFAAPLLATAAADKIGIVPMLLVAAALRAAGTGLFAILGIGNEAEEAAGVHPA
jgi:MFS family permease